MNILQISELYKSGGASEIMQLISEGLIKRNNIVINIYSKGDACNNDKTDLIYYDNSSFFRRQQHRFLGNFIEKLHLQSLANRIFILKIIRKQKIDFIQMHAMQNTFLTIKDIVWLSKKIKIVWTLHDTWIFTGGCIAFMQCNKWKTARCVNCELPSSFIYSMDETPNIAYQNKLKYLSKIRCYFISPSKWNQENLKKSYLADKQIKVINNGIKDNVFLPLTNREQLRHKNHLSKKVLLFSAAITSLPWKGWDLLYNALLQLKEPDEYELIVIGNVNSDIDNLPIHMIKAGYVHDKNKLNEYYNMADLFIIPSRQDNFPTVVIESMFAGTPVLGFKTGGIPEQLAAGRGWLADEMTSESLKNKIEEIFSTGYEERLAKQRIKVAKESRMLYSQDIMVQNYIELYRELFEKAL